MPKKETEINHSQTDASCILLLTEAEKRARELVDAAKKRKAALVKKAKDDSAQEIEAFRKLNEENLIKVQRQYSSGQDTDAVKFEKELEKKKIELKQAFKSNFQSTLRDLLTLFVNIKPEFHENLKNF